MNFDVRSSKLFNKRYVPGEYSDRVINLNKLEARNLENKLRFIDKEKQIGLNIILKDIKKLENELEIRNETLKIIQNKEKLKKLSSTLHISLLNTQTNDYINDDLSSSAYFFKSNENENDGSKKRETSSVDLYHQQSDKDIKNDEFIHNEIKQDDEVIMIEDRETNDTPLESNRKNLLSVSFKQIDENQDTSPIETSPKIVDSSSELRDSSKHEMISRASTKLTFNLPYSDDEAIKREKSFIVNKSPLTPISNHSYLMQFDKSRTSSKASNKLMTTPAPVLHKKKSKTSLDLLHLRKSSLYNPPKPVETNKKSKSDNTNNSNINKNIQKSVQKSSFQIKVTKPSLVVNKLQTDEPAKQDKKLINVKVTNIQINSDFPLKTFSTNKNELVNLPILVNKSLRK